jgi:hypothetical protein
MGNLAHVLVHRAWTRTLAPPPAESWEEGEPGGGAIYYFGRPFPAILFLPLGEEQPAPWKRAVTRPTLMWEPVRPDGTAVVVSYTDELIVDAPELAGYTGDDVTRWQIEGAPQPFGPPGIVIGAQATLRQDRGGG